MQFEGEISAFDVTYLSVGGGDICQVQDWQGNIQLIKSALGRVSVCMHVFKCVCV